jgi:hypothetical protein
MFLRIGMALRRRRFFPLRHVAARFGGENIALYAPDRSTKSQLTCVKAKIGAGLTMII